MRFIVKCNFFEYFSFFLFFMLILILLLSKTSQHWLCDSIKQLKWFLRVSYKQVLFKMILKPENHFLCVYLAFVIGIRYFEKSEVHTPCQFIVMFHYLFKRHIFNIVEVGINFDWSEIMVLLPMAGCICYHEQMNHSIFVF